MINGEGRYDGRRGKMQHVCLGSYARRVVCRGGEVCECECGCGLASEAGIYLEVVSIMVLDRSGSCSRKELREGWSGWVGRWMGGWCGRWVAW